MGVVTRPSTPLSGVPWPLNHQTERSRHGLSRPELLARFQTEARRGIAHSPQYRCGISMPVKRTGSTTSLWNCGRKEPAGDAGCRSGVPTSADAAHHGADLQRAAVSRTSATCAPRHQAANLMLTGGDTVKITDFGTAKILQFGTVQQTAHVMGTPSYMSPEQVKGAPWMGAATFFRWRDALRDGDRRETLSRTEHNHGDLQDC